MAPTSHSVQGQVMARYGPDEDSHLQPAIPKACRHRIRLVSTMSTHRHSVCKSFRNSSQHDDAASGLPLGEHQPSLQLANANNIGPLKNRRVHDRFNHQLFDLREREYVALSKQPEANPMHFLGTGPFHSTRPPPTVPSKKRPRTSVQHTISRAAPAPAATFHVDSPRNSAGLHAEPPTQLHNDERVDDLTTTTTDGTLDTVFDCCVGKYW